ncbi:hypothetical protein B6A10_15245 [Flavobacterium sp. L1I52]|uniref:Uncharacterized protein n=1 Tax=Flavobacterium pokkalii TaxID=1940408 RepID=A0ABR7UY24_9FLAO|nr:hypothetical protein [Flavobacterium pokkalii]MBD0726529.1 hypothetical protein [Flavobacterium pokkalii]
MILEVSFSTKGKPVVIPKGLKILKIKRKQIKEIYQQLNAGIFNDFIELGSGNYLIEYFKE